jgi:hypothetical protein
VTVSPNGTPALAAATPSASMTATGIFPTGASPLINHLIVAHVTLYGTTTCTLGALPAGWFLFSTVAATATTLSAYYAKVATGSDSAPVFAGTTTGTAGDASLQVVLFDLSDSGGGVPVITTDGINTGTSGATLTATTNLAVLAGSVALASICVSQGTTAGTAAWTPPSGWSSAGNQTASLRSQQASFINTAPSAGSALAVALPKGRTTTTEQAGLVMVISPPGSQPILALDSVGPGPGRDPGAAAATAAGSSASTTVSWTQAIQGDPWGNKNLVLAVGVSVGASVDTGLTITSVKVGTTAMTAAGPLVHAGGLAAGYAQAFWLADSTGTILTPGGTVTITVTMSSAPSSLVAGSIAWNGAAASIGTVFSNFDVTGGAGSTPATLTLTSTTLGRQIFGYNADGSGDGTGPVFPVIRRGQKLQASSSAAGAGEFYSAASAGGSQTITNNITVDDWAIIAFEIIPAAGAAPAATPAPVVVPQAAVMQAAIW